MLKWGKHLELVAMSVPLVSEHVASSRDRNGRGVGDSRVDGSSVARGGVHTGGTGRHVDGGSDGNGCGSRANIVTASSSGGSRTVGGGEGHYRKSSVAASGCIVSMVVNDVFGWRGNLPSSLGRRSDNLNVVTDIANLRLLRLALTLHGPAQGRHVGRFSVRVSIH